MPEYPVFHSGQHPNIVLSPTFLTPPAHVHSLGVMSAPVVSPPLYLHGVAWPLHRAALDTTRSPHASEQNPMALPDGTSNFVS